MFGETNNTDAIDLEPGIYNDISFDQYKKIDAINHSTLTKFMEESPFHYYYKREKGNLWKSTKALNEGRVIHEAVLEPENFKEKYVKEPNDWRSYEKFMSDQEVEYCEEKEAEAGREGQGGMSFLHGGSNAYGKIMNIFEAKLGDDKEAISPELLNKCRQIRENVKENQACQNLFEGANFEVTMVWIDEETDLKCKGRLDVNSQMKGYACDLKKSRTTNPKWVPNEVMKYNYNSQASFYMDGAEKLGMEKIKAFVWILVEAEDPHYILPYYTRANSDWITTGRSWYKQAIEKLHYCRRTGDWHGFYDAENETYDMFELPEMY